MIVQQYRKCRDGNVVGGSKMDFSELWLFNFPYNASESFTLFRLFCLLLWLWLWPFLSLAVGSSLRCCLVSFQLRLAFCYCCCRCWCCWCFVQSNCVVASVINRNAVNFANSLHESTTFPAEFLLNHVFFS